MTEEPVRGRQAPHSLEAERSVIGAMLLDRDLSYEALENLGADDFYDRRNQTVFRVCAELERKGRVLDLVTVSEDLKRTGQLEGAGGLDYLASLTDDIPVLSNVSHHIQIIKDCSLLRKLVKVSQENIQEVFDGADEPRSILDRAEKRIMEVGEEVLKGELVHIARLLGAGIDSLETLKNAKDSLTGLPSGFPELDRLTTGFHGGELIILAARPGIGKTSMALNICTHVAQETDAIIALFSLEMSSRRLSERMICSQADVGLKALRQAMGQEAFFKLQEAADTLHRMNIYIDDTASLSAMEVRAKARGLKRREGLDLVVVDYLQLMRSEVRAENRQQEIASISGSLKALAKELDVPVIALSQLSRLADRRAGPPMLSDLRESGAIEQDADLVLFLSKNRDNEAMMDEPDDFDLFEQEVTLKIGKQRNGPIGDIQLVFNGATTRFMPALADGLDRRP